METIELSGHVVICNWTPKASSLIEQLHADIVSVKRPIVVISSGIENCVFSEDAVYDEVYFIPGDPSSDRVLARANIAKAYAAVILADPGLDEHADSRSILIALAIEAIEPRVHTCVELLKANNRNHFRHTRVDEVICVDDLANKLIAQSCLTPGLSAVYLSLLTATEDSNELYIVPVPQAYIGQRYADLAVQLAGPEGPDVVLLGFARPGADGARELTINPVHSVAQHMLTAADSLVFLAYRMPEL